LYTIKFIKRKGIGKEKVLHVDVGYRPEPPKIYVSSLSFISL
jgi:hypothetical protein